MNRIALLFSGAAALSAYSVSSYAVSIQTQSNEVADGAIVIDPNAEGDRRLGWETAIPYSPADVDAVTPVLGIETVTVAHDSTNFYFRLAVDQFDVNDPQQSFFGAHYALFIDSDRDRSTGYIGDDGDPNVADGVLPIGADRLIEGPALFRYGNLGNPGGANQELFTWGSIIPFGNMLFDDGPVSDIEFQVERSQLGDPEAFDFYVYTTTEAFETQDVFPNDANTLTGDFFTYSTIPVASGIDGDYNDSGLVEQGDLDQVLSNWGAGFAGIPATWINQRPTEGIVDQAELDVVLTQWGSSSAPSFAGSAVPEPASAALLSLTALGLMARRRSA